MCLNNERRDDIYRKCIYERIQLRSEETKYKNIDERNRILNEKIGDFVQTISVSERCEELMRLKILPSLADSNNFFQKHSVSEFLKVLLENTQGQNTFEQREFNILKEIEITQQDRELFSEINFIHVNHVRGRKKKMFKTNRYLQ